MRKTLYQICESVIATPQGGKFSDETQISFQMVCSKINECRNIVAEMRWAKYRQVHPDWLQRFYPEYLEEIQEKCKMLFKVPGIILLDKHTDGIQYVGSRDYSNGFRKVSDRQTFSSMSKHPVMNRSKNNRYLYEAGDMEVYSELKANDLMVVAVFSDPRDIPTYNVEKDPYPVDAGSVEMIEELVRNKIIMMSEKTPADVRSDSADAKK